MLFRSIVAQNGGHVLVQSQSCFILPAVEPHELTDFDELAGYAPATSANAPSAERASTNLENNFTRTVVGPCSEEGYVDFSYDDSVKRYLFFFLPVLIWEYLSIKKRIVKDDRKIHAQRVSLRLGEIDLTFNFLRGHQENVY